MDGDPTEIKNLWMACRETPQCWLRTHTKDFGTTLDHGQKAKKARQATRFRLV